MLSYLFIVYAIKDNLSIPKLPISVPILLLLILLILCSIWFTVYPEASRQTVIHWLVFFSVFILVVYTTKSRKSKNILLYGIICTGFIYTCIALLFRGYIISGFEIVYSGNTNVSLMVGHNLFIGIICICLFLFLGWAFSLSGYKKSISAFSAIFILAVIYSTSRSGVIVLLLCIGMFIFLSGLYSTCSIKIKLIGISVFAILALIPTLFSLHKLTNLNNFDSIHSDSNIRNRFYYAQAAIHLISDNPLTGTGPGTTVYSLSRYKDRFMVNTAVVHPNEGLPKVGLHYNSLGKHLHNDHLQLLAEIGIIGYSLLLWIFAIITVNFFKRLSTLSASERYLKIGIFCAVSSFLLNMCFDLPLQTPPNAILFSMVLGLMASKVFNKPLSYSQTYTIPSKFKLPTLAGTIIITIALITIFIKPVLAYTNYQKAIATYKDNDLTSALAYISAAIESENTNAEYWSTKGLFYQQLAFQSESQSEEQYHLENAIIAINKAIERCPIRSYYYSQLAQCYNALGERNKEFQALLKAAEYSPIHFQTLADLGEFYLRNHEFNEAQPIYLRLFDLLAQGVDEWAVSFDVLYNYVCQTQSLLAEERFTEKDMLSLLPENPYVYHAMARDYQDNKNTDKAMSWYQQAIDRYQPTFIGKKYHALAYQSLANLQFAKGDTTAALASLQKAYKKNPTQENALHHAAFAKKMGLTTKAKTIARQYQQLYQDNQRLAQLANGE